MNYQNIVDLIRNTANLVNPTGHFVHGRNTDGSLDYDYSFPQIHLLPVETTYDIPNDIKTHTLILMFWEQDSPESTNLEREQKIAAMDVLSDNFLNVLYNINTINIEDVLKTPEYRQLAGTASGYGLSFSIVSKVDCLPEPIQPCEGVVVLINGEFYTEIPSGESQNILVQYENGDPVGTIVGDIIEIPNPPVCEDATAVLKDTDGNILSTTNIPSGTSQDITAPDGSITVENTASTILATDTVLSGGSTTVVIPDITFTDSDGSTSSVPAGQNITASPCQIMTADFSADILTPNLFQNIQFTDLTNNSPTNWGWDFGDGTLSALQNPVKSYNTAGSFNVTLLAGKNNLGDVITKTGYITVTYVGLLDLYPNAAVAYSVRLLRGNYTGNCIRVRRSNDNAEQNIGFTGAGVLDIAALLSFVGANNGFVTTWYDQSGNGNNMIQSTLTLQPQIVTSGNVNVLNGLPALNANTTFKAMRTTSTLSYNECLIATVFNRTGRLGTNDSLYLFITSPFNQLYSGTTQWSYFSGANFNTSINLSASQQLITQVDNGTNTLFYQNNTLINTFAVSGNVNNFLEIIGGSTVNYGIAGNMQEFVLYNTDRSSDRAGINSNIQTYYGI